MREYCLQIILNELKQQIVGIESTIESTICTVFKFVENNSNVKFAPTKYINKVCFENMKNCVM